MIASAKAMLKPDDAERAPTELNRFRHAHEVVAHEGHVPVSMAVSAPAPIAMPMLAAASAGASFTPSPIMPNAAKLGGEFPHALDFVFG